MKRIYLILTVLAIAVSCTKTAAPKLDLDKDTSLLGLKLDTFEAVPVALYYSSTNVEQLTLLTRKELTSNA